MRWFFFLIFSLVLVFGVTATVKGGPFYLAETLDPEYAYLFNGLNIAVGREPSHVDHPGTTLQSIIAAGIFISSLFHAEGKIHFTIQHAENILLFYNLLFIFVAAVVTGLIAVEMRKAVSIPQVFFLLATCFLNFETLRAFARVSPEPVLLLCSLAITYLMIKFMNQQEHDENSRSHHFWISFWLAVGLITKITFLPVLFFLGFNYDNKEKLKYSLKKFFLVAFICFLPALGSFKGILRWFGDIISHTGSYGQGSVGVISVPRLHGAMTVLLSQQILFTGAFLLGAYLVFANRKFLRKSDKKVAFIALAGFALQLLMFIKHPGPGRYLLPAIGMLPFFLYVLFSRLPLHPFFKGVLICLFGFQLYQNYVMIRAYLQRTPDFYHISQYPISKKDALICSYPCSRDVFALHFGNTFAGKHYAKDLFQQYPYFYDFSILPEDNKLYDFNKDTHTMDELFESGLTVYVQGPPDRVEPRLPQASDIEITSLVHNSNEALYMLRKK